VAASCVFSSAIVPTSAGAWLTGVIVTATVALDVPPWPSEIV